MNIQPLKPSSEGKRRLAKATTFEDHLQEALQNPKLRKIWENNKTKRELRKALIELRAIHNLTQKQLAQKLQTDQANVSKWETGQVTPSIEALAKIAKIFDKELYIKFL